MSKPASCSIGVLGTFDTDLFDDALAPRVLRRELKARLPGAKIITFAPYGALRPTPRDGGEAAEPLGRWSPDRAAVRRGCSTFRKRVTFVLKGSTSRHALS